MHRRLVVVAVVSLLAALMAPAAFADQPTIDRMPVETHGTVQSCAFPVQVDATGTLVRISYTDQLGNLQRFDAAPEYKSTLTNLVTGKRIVIANSGPGRYTFGADGSLTQVGTGVWSFLTRNPVTLEPGLFFTKGRFVLSRSASGVRTFTLTGTIIDMCAELA
jgi:hypothetical protein